MIHMYDMGFLAEGRMGGQCDEHGDPVGSYPFGVAML
jgi:hypothetical protein